MLWQRYVFVRIKSKTVKTSQEQTGTVQSSSSTRPPTVDDSNVENAVKTFSPSSRSKTTVSDQPTDPLSIVVQEGSIVDSTETVGNPTSLQFSHNYQNYRPDPHFGPSHPSYNNIRSSYSISPVCANQQQSYNSNTNTFVHPTNSHPVYHSSGFIPPNDIVTASTSNSGKGY